MDVCNVLKAWYAKNKRDLPWRRTSDPYKIWLSEIILQQTRVDQGLSYYNKFSKRFPNVSSLAKAHEDEVLLLWQGLGYYSRARNMHAAAKDIVRNYQGSFPTKYSEILGLKGVGEYTAAAIASFAFGLAYPVVDGNVYRFLSRLYDVSIPIDTAAGKKYFKQLAEELMDENQPGEYNQAIMEFGALQCKPSNPECGICAFEASCLAKASGEIGNRPVKKSKTKTRVRYFNYIYIRNEADTYIKKRDGKDIWQSLYELPLIERESSIDAFQLLQAIEKELGIRNSYVTQFNKLDSKIHKLSHQTIYADFWELTCKASPEVSGLLQIAAEDLSDYAMPQLIKAFLESNSS